MHARGAMPLLGVAQCYARRRGVSTILGRPRDGSLALLIPLLLAPPLPGPLPMPFGVAPEQCFMVLIVFAINVYV